MTKQLEEELGLPPTFDSISDESEGEQNDIDYESEIQTQEDNATNILNALSAAEKIDYALATVSELDEYVDEMDDIAKEALSAYKDTLLLGMNYPIGNASRLLEVANMMLRTALDAKSNKAAHRLKTVELQLRKARIDQEGGGYETVGPGLNHKDIVDVIREGLSKGNGPENIPKQISNEKSPDTDK
jgi:hypothetical protein